MIAYWDLLPLLEDERGVANLWQDGWLRAALVRAAEQAGYAEWPVVDDLADSVLFYLKHSYPKRVIPVARLEEAVRGTLSDIGYAEVARCFSTLPLQARVSLAHCLPALPTTDTTAFFRCLCEQIESLRRDGVSRFHFYDLEACVVRLQGEGFLPKSATVVWRRKIVAFVRKHMKAAQWSREVHCSIS